VKSPATFLAANDMPGHVDDVTTEGMPALVLSGRNKVSRPAPVKGGNYRFRKAPSSVKQPPERLKWRMRNPVYVFP
jgi:hypothetical protein